MLLLLPFLLPPSSVARSLNRQSVDGRRTELPTPGNGNGASGRQRTDGRTNATELEAELVKQASKPDLQAGETNPRYIEPSQK